MFCEWCERIWSNLLPTEIRWLLIQIRPLLHWQIASFLCITAGSLLALLIPLILKWLIDGIIPGRRTGLLLLAVAMIFFVYESRAALNSFGSYLMTNAALKLSLNLRMNLLRHMNKLSAEHYEQTLTGAVIYPMKEPVDEISYFGSDLLPAMLRMALTTGFTLATMLMLSPVLTFAIMPLVPLFLITRQRYRRRLQADADIVQNDRLLWTDLLQEHLSSIIPIQLLGQENAQERRAFRLMARSVRSQQQLNWTGVKFSVGSCVAVAAATCAVIGYGGASVVYGRLSLGSLVAFYGFATQLFDPLTGAAELYARTQKMLSSIRQVRLVLALQPAIKNAKAPVSLTRNLSHSVRLTNMKFGYSRNKDFLEIPSLEIAAGEHVAITGENGAGKSTLAKLMARIYDPLSGSIQFGGVDVRKFDLKDLRKKICYVPREPILFAGTLLSNLRFICPDATENDLRDVICQVGLSTFVATLPQGLHQRVGPGGCHLSGGERQRLALARALLQKPRILILDEATSCVDSWSERTLIENIRVSHGTGTLIVISHRPSCVKMFRRALVLSTGRIISDELARDSHKDSLLANSGPHAVS